MGFMSHLVTRLRLRLALVHNRQVILQIPSNMKQLQKNIYNCEHGSHSMVDAANNWQISCILYPQRTFNLHLSTYQVKTSCYYYKYFHPILSRNKAHLLPYFLTSLEKQSYPKSRIILYLRSDNNQVKCGQHSWELFCVIIP